MQDEENEASLVLIEVLDEDRLGQASKPGEARDDQHISGVTRVAKRLKLEETDQLETMIRTLGKLLLHRFVDARL